MRWSCKLNPHLMGILKDIFHTSWNLPEKAMRLSTALLKNSSEVEGIALANIRCQKGKSAGKGCDGPRSLRFGSETLD